MRVFERWWYGRRFIQYYIRYADDFVIFSNHKQQLENLVPQIKDFLQNELKLTLHPDKVYIKTLASGVDFLGWVNFTDHRILRTTTKRRMLKKLEVDKRPEVMNSYLGLLRHGNTFKLKDAMIPLINGK